VREVIEDRATGFVCLDRESMEKAVAQIATIDRRRCRQAFESRFSDSVIVNRYEELYRQRMGLR
jgi:glycosyltransferase involved in cell wall biosynthesis